MIITRSQDAGIKLWVEALVFLCSYYPLFLILFIRDIGSPVATVPFGSLNVSWWALVGISFSSICTLLTGCIMRTLLTSAEGGNEIILTDVREARGDMINYTLPFLIGLFAFDYKTFQSVASLIVFLVFMFGFTRREGIILLNPMFLLMGIRLYDINFKKVGQPNKEHTASALCMGIAKKSESKVRFLENSGINFISATVDR